MYRLLFLLTAFLPGSGIGQIVSTGNFNSEDTWKKTRLISVLPAQPFTASDTAIIVVSNRKQTDDTLRFMSEHREASALHYYFVFAHKGNWYVLPVKNLESAVQLMPSKERNWVAYTEGMGKLFTTDIFRGMLLSAEYGVNVIMFDYPSITTTKSALGNYFFAIGNARQTYRYFGDVFAHLKKLKQEGNLGSGKLSLFNHSMGNHLMRGIARHQQLIAINDTEWVDNLVLNAPCVQRRGHKKWIDKINFAKNIYVNYNKDDVTLGGAYLVSKKLQLGHRPNKCCSKKAIYVNFNALCGQNHSNFLTVAGLQVARPNAVKYYNIVLHGNKPNLTDTQMFRTSTYHSIGWELLP